MDKMISICCTRRLRTNVLHFCSAKEKSAREVAKLLRFTFKISKLKFKALFMGGRSVSRFFYVKLSIFLIKNRICSYRFHYTVFS